MSEYDPDFRFLLEIDEDERRAALGEHILGMIDDPRHRKEEQTRDLFDTLGRAMLAREDKAE